MKTFTTVKVLSRCKYVLLSQFPGPRARTRSHKTGLYFEKRTIFKFDRKVRLVVKKYDNFNQIPTFKWKSNNND